MGENEFTNAEKNRINELYATDFNGITPDDALLIGRWEAAKALNEAETVAKFEAMQAETEAKLEQSRALYEQAKGTLEDLRNRAIARLEAIDDE